MPRELRRLSNAKSSKVGLVKSRPSSDRMAEGQEAYYVNIKGSQGAILTHYKKAGGILWSSPMLRDRLYHSDAFFPEARESSERKGANKRSLNIDRLSKSLEQKHLNSSDRTVFSNKVKTNNFDILLKNRSNDIDSFCGIAFDPTPGDTDGSVGASITGLADNAATDLHDTNLVFATNDGDVNGLTERVRITNDGKVGIGTSLPSSALEINGVLTMGGGIEMDDNSISDVKKLAFDDGSTFMTEFNDTDDFSDASSTGGASSESIKAYVDGAHYVTYTTDNRPNTSSARYITWDKGGRATASLTYLSMKAEIIMPFAGTIISLTIYPDNNTTADWGSTVAQIYKNRSSVSPAGDVTVTVDHQTTELFTFPDGNAFVAGDRMAILLTPSSTMQYFVASLLVKFTV